MELDGADGFVAGIASAKVASVTRRRFSRDRSCRRRFEACPFGVFDQTRLRSRLSLRRRTDTQSPQQAPTDAHDGQNT
ncbi:MAG: hypothetical protein HYV09_26905 [Deltaproteobacteria bacterium]|nr:hypothetical protein [Deltaproteobacteria bacterium]